MLFCLAFVVVWLVLLVINRGVLSGLTGFWCFLVSFYGFGFFLGGGFCWGVEVASTQKMGI